MKTLDIELCRIAILILVNHDKLAYFCLLGSYFVLKIFLWPSVALFMINWLFMRKVKLSWHPTKMSVKDTWTWFRCLMHYDASLKVSYLYEDEQNISKSNVFAFTHKSFRFAKHTVISQFRIIVEAVLFV